MSPAIQGVELGAETVEDAGADARVRDGMTAGGGYQRTVDGQRHLKTGGHERHVSGRQTGVELVFKLVLDVKHLTALADLAHPFHVDAPGFLAELEHDDFLRFRHAIDLFAARGADDVRIDARIPGDHFAVVAGARKRLAYSTSATLLHRRGRRRASAEA